MSLHGEFGQGRPQVGFGLHGNNPYYIGVPMQIPLRLHNLIGVSQISNLSTDGNPYCGVVNYLNSVVSGEKIYLS